MRVLAIETSCDETAAAVVERARDHVRVLSSVVASQANLHARTKGVVPEVAARAHVEAITYVIGDAMEGIESSKQKGVSSIDMIAATTEPGLKPALVVGETAARALAVAWEKSFQPVHHIAGHIAAAWLPREFGIWNMESGVTYYDHGFPALALVVSGGHTQLWKLEPKSAKPGAGNWEPALLGQTRDDAAGEAFDKIARLLGLSYPGGPALARLAEKGDACAFSFPRPMIDSGNDDFSFSGLKTAVYYTVRDLQPTTHNLQPGTRADLAASAQEAIVDVLVAKTVNAAAREGAAEVILTGGVAANKRLRERLAEALGTSSDAPSKIGGDRGGIPLILPHPQYCTDNAAMIGAAAVLGIEIPATTGRQSG